METSHCLLRLREIGYLYTIETPWCSNIWTARQRHGRFASVHGDYERPLKNGVSVAEFEYLDTAASLAECCELGLLAIRLLLRLQQARRHRFQLDVVRVPRLARKQVHQFPVPQSRDLYQADWPRHVNQGNHCPAAVGRAAELDAPRQLTRCGVGHLEQVHAIAREHCTEGSG